MNCKWNQILLGLGTFVLIAGTSRGAPPRTDYVVGYIHTLTIADDSSGGLDGNGEIAVVIGTSDGSDDNTKVVRFPKEEWEVTKVTDKVLTRYQDPFTVSTPDGPKPTKPKLNLRDTKRPWGLPFFSERVDQLPEVLGLTMTVVEFDDPGDVAETATALAGPVATFAATVATSLAGGAGVGGLVTKIAEVITGFRKMDTLAAHVNRFTKQELLDRVRTYNASADRITVAGDATNVEGEVELGYVFRTVSVPCGAEIRVTMGDVRHYGNGDLFTEPSGEIVVFTHVWNGLWDGLQPDDAYYKFRKEDLDEGEWWNLSEHPHNFLYSGELGPFLAVDFGVWDEDPTNEDDLMGNVFGLWLTDDLINGLNREPGRKVRYTVKRSEDGELKTLSFSLKLLSAGIDFSTLSVSPNTVLLNQSFNVCRTIRNECDSSTANLNVVLRVDGKIITHKAVSIGANTETRVCFPHKFTNTSDTTGDHKVNITADGTNGWPEGKVTLSFPFSPF